MTIVRYANEEPLTMWKVPLENGVTVIVTNNVHGIKTAFWQTLIITPLRGTGGIAHHVKYLGERYWHTDAFSAAEKYVKAHFGLDMKWHEMPF